jgi:O-antigen/teichoic acid export membrane protein
MSLIAAFSGLGLNIGLIRYLQKEDDKEGMINSCLLLFLPLIVTIGIGLAFQRRF